MPRYTTPDLTEFALNGFYTLFCPIFSPHLDNEPI